MDAPVLLQSHDGQSPLNAATQSGNEAVVRRLLDYIKRRDDILFDLNEPNLDGVPLLHTLIIARNINMIPLLFEYGASALARDSHGRTCAHIVAQVTFHLQKKFQLSEHIQISSYLDTRDFIKSFFKICANSQLKNNLKSLHYINFLIFVSSTFSVFSSPALKIRIIGFLSAF